MTLAQYIGTYKGRDPGAQRALGAFNSAKNILANRIGRERKNIDTAALESNLNHFFGNGSPNIQRALNEITIKQYNINADLKGQKNISTATDLFNNEKYIMETDIEGLIRGLNKQLDQTQILYNRTYFNAKKLVEAYDKYILGKTKLYQLGTFESMRALEELTDNFGDCISFMYEVKKYFNDIEDNRQIGLTSGAIGTKVNTFTQNVFKNVHEEVPSVQEIQNLLSKMDLLMKILDAGHDPLSNKIYGDSGEILIMTALGIVDDLKDNYTSVVTKGALKTVANNIKITGGNVVSRKGNGIGRSSDLVNFTIDLDNLDSKKITNIVEGYNENEKTKQKIVGKRYVDGKIDISWKIDDQGIERLSYDLNANAQAKAYGLATLSDTKNQKTNVGISAKNVISLDNIETSSPLLNILSRSLDNTAFQLFLLTLQMPDKYDTRPIVKRTLEYAKKVAEISCYSDLLMGLSQQRRDMAQIMVVLNRGNPNKKFKVIDLVQECEKIINNANGLFDLKNFNFSTLREQAQEILSYAKAQSGITSMKRPKNNGTLNQQTTLDSIYLNMVQAQLHSIMVVAKLKATI